MQDQDQDQLEYRLVQLTFTLQFVGLLLVFGWLLFWFPEARDLTIGFGVPILVFSFIALVAGLLMAKRILGK